MTVLLTGASGFVGSHVLDTLLQAGIPTRLLLRSRSSRRFIQARLPEVDVCEGSIDQPDSLPAAMRSVTHVIHCAGLVKALRIREFHDINRVGTRNTIVTAQATYGALVGLDHPGAAAAAGDARDWITETGSLVYLGMFADGLPVAEERAAGTA